MTKEIFIPRLEDAYKRGRGWYPKDVKEALENISKEGICLGCWTYPVNGRCGCKFGGNNKQNIRN